MTLYSYGHMTVLFCFSTIATIFKELNDSQFFCYILFSIMFHLPVFILILHIYCITLVTNLESPR